MTINAEQKVKEMEEAFFEAAKKLAMTIVEQAEAAGLDQYMLACACDMISQGVKDMTEKEIISRYGSMEEAEKAAMSMLEEKLKEEEASKHVKGQKIVDITAARGASKTIH